MARQSRQEVKDRKRDDARFHQAAQERDPIREIACSLVRIPYRHRRIGQASRTVINGIAEYSLRTVGETWDIEEEPCAIGAKLPDRYAYPGQTRANGRPL